MTETCDRWLSSKQGLCAEAAAIVESVGHRRCLAHATLAPGYHLLSDAQILTIVGEAVATAERECLMGHEWKQDEVALGVWRTVLRLLAEGENHA